MDEITRRGLTRTVKVWRNMANSLDQKAKDERARPDTLPEFRAGLEARRDTYLMCAENLERVLTAVDA